MIRVKAAGGRAVPLRVKGGFHSPFMAEAAQNFSEILEKVCFRPPQMPLYSDYTGLPYGDDYVTLLSRQICRPVRWQDIITHMEKYIHPARHIEMQLLADECGNTVCLGERDCSIQRRNQKLIEESLSPAVSEKQRNAVMEQVSKAVKHLGYVGVGTLEFLFDEAGIFYFMEMNVRLQVEHTVTESLTGIDIVKWQIRVSAGIPLNFEQKDIVLKGSSIECRINALAPGTVAFLHGR